MTRRVRFTAAGVAAVLLVAVLAVAALLTTAPGLNFALRFALPLVADVATVDRVEGRLIGPLVVHGIAWQAGGYRGRVERLAVDWSLGPLLRRQVVVHDLEASGVVVEALDGARSEPRQPGEPRAWPDAIPLPVTVDVARVAILDGRVTPTPGAEVLAIDALRFAVHTVDGTVSVEGLKLTAERLGLTGSLALTTGDDYRADAALDWWLALADLPRAGGRFEATIARQAARFEQAFDSPARARLTGRGDFAGAEPVWETTLALPETDAASVNPTWPALTVGATLRASGTGARGDLAGSVTLPAVLPEPLTVDGTLRAEGQRLLIERLTLALAALGSRLRASGEVDAGASNGPALRAQIDWERLTWPLDETPVATSERGSLTLEGTPERFAFQTAAGLDGPSLPAVALSAAGTGTAEALNVAQLRAELLGGTVSGGATVVLSPAPAATLELVATDLDPGVEFADWNGALGFTLDASATEDSVDARLTELGGTLRGYPWRGDGRVRLQSGTWTVERLALTGEGTRLALSGTTSDTLDLRWELSADDLAVLHPQAVGTVRSSGTLRGTAAAPQLEAELAGEAVRWGEHGAGTVTLSAVLDGGNATASTARLQAARLQVAGRPLGQLDASIDGRADDHAVSLRLSGSDGAVATQARGAWADARWQGAVTDVTVEPAATPTWTLTQPAPLALAADDASLAPLCLANSDEKACIDATWSPTAGV
ncbi:MAG: hypothetical protein AAGD86_00290, partial [Pseudomonadota bacterium]